MEHLRVNNIGVDTQSSRIFEGVDVESAKFEFVTVGDTGQAPRGSIFDIDLLGDSFRWVFCNRNGGRVAVVVVDPNGAVSLDVGHLRERPNDRNESLRDMDGVTFEVINATGEQMRCRSRAGWSVTGTGAGVKGRYIKKGRVEFTCHSGV